jgi:iron complex transport system ATP-binding protein
MTDPTVVAREVSYRVRGASLVSAVDFRASPGELVVIIGPNGAGKSTLLGLLSGNLSPSEGEVTLNGADVSSAAPADLALERAILTQREAMDIPFTARQVVEMGRFPHRRDPDNAAEVDQSVVTEAMTLTDTRQFADRVFATLSKGEQTRVSLARVLAQAAPVLFLDEPTTALDVGHAERIMEQAVSQARAGRTVVVVLHDLNAAAVHGDRIVLMSGGVVVADGSSHDVLRAELLSDIYGQPMTVVDHPFRECPLVLSGQSRA